MCEENINPIQIIRSSRFNHYLIENEFVLEMKTYENMFHILKDISDSIDKFDTIYRRRKRLELFIKGCIAFEIMVFIYIAIKL